MLTWLEEPRVLPITELPNEPNKLRLRLMGLRSDNKNVAVIADIEPPEGSRSAQFAKINQKLAAMRTQIDMYLEEGCKCSMPKEYQKEPCVVHGEVAVQQSFAD
jgi:hypothetical protein